MRLTKHQTELIGSLRYKVERLEELSKSLNLYDTIEGAGLVRDLLLSDECGLFGAVGRDIPGMQNPRNRKLRFNVKFNGSMYQARLKDTPIMMAAPGRTMICPHIILSDKHNLTRDDFLKLPILCGQHGHYNFKDLVAFAANKLGSRHFDRASGSDQQLVLHEIREQFGFESFDPVTTPLRGLYPVVVSTGNELIDRIDNLSS
jgi:hypothetical protein